MKQERTIGLFVLGAGALVVVGLTILGAGRWFRGSTVIMMTFEGAVTGLTRGSKVTFQGVEVGSVTSVSIDLEPDHRLAVSVTAKIDPEEKAFTRVEGGSAKFLIGLIKNGLKARLVSMSFVTGMLQIQLELKPEKTGFVVANPERYPGIHIPTIPGTLERAATKLERILDSLQGAPIEDMVGSLQKSLAALERNLESPELQAILTGSSASATHLASLLEYLDAQKEGITDRVNVSLEGLAGAAAGADSLMASLTGLAPGADSLMAGLTELASGLDRTRVSLDEVVAVTKRTLKAYEALALPDSPVQQELLQTLNTFESTAQQIRQLAETLQRNPESILTGKQR